MDSENSQSDSDSDFEGQYDLCRLDRPDLSSLPFDHSVIENIILQISDKFDFRVLWNNRRMRRAFLVTAGLSVAGSIIGSHYGGKQGAAIGGVVGGACGVGFVVVSMRDIWEDVKPKLSEVYDVVYDYLAGLGFEDYQRAAYFLFSNGDCSKQLALLILQISSDLLGQKILSSLTSA
ncbi:uncharacterized protein [Battus philenor]|uniref:uncharacterized protein n=1 Tax=Battus philenor TaxID=42288 RepID=UPI0035CF092F